MIYELLYIVPNKYSEDETKEIHLKILELAKKQEFEIIHEENLGNKKLAYPIKNSYYGYYLLIHFKLDEKANLAIFKQKLEIMPEILRSQIIKYKELPKKVGNLKQVTDNDKELITETKIPPTIPKKTEEMKAEEVKPQDQSPVSVETAEKPNITQEEILKVKEKVGEAEEKKEEEITTPKKTATKEPSKKKLDLNELDKKIDELLENVDG